MTAIVTQLPRAKRTKTKAKPTNSKAPIMATDINDNATRPLDLTVSASTPASQGANTSVPAKPDTTVAKGMTSWPELAIPAEVDPTLATILSWPRRHNTMSELAFHGWLALKLPSLGIGLKVKEHSERALSVTIPGPKGSVSTTLFSCHIDTVDTLITDPAARKKLAYDASFGHIFLAKDNTVGSCLGADDGIGVWIMLKMIEAKVPGTYLFNRGEECGGVSAKAIASKERDWLAQFQLAVAFDRPNDHEVITHQRGGTRCASDKFGTALALALNKAEPSFSYKPSKAGVYTDTFDFRKEIAECVNIGVGYTNQHGSGETQDYAHAYALMKACCTVDWEALPVDRDPKEAEPTYNSYYQRDAWAFGNDDRDAWGHAKKYKAPAPAPAPAPAYKAKTKVVEPVLNIEDEILDLGSVGDIAVLAQEDPDMVAQLLVQVSGELAALRAQLAFLKQMTFNH